MRPSAAVEGATKSVGNTGSQITKTRTSWLLISRSNCPVAEAPCKQTAQVGESITTTRIEDAEPLNAVFRGLQRSQIARRKTDKRRLSLGRRVSAIEVIHGPKGHQKNRKKKDSRSTHDLPAKRSANRLAITCGKKMNINTTNAENHKRNVLIRLGLQLHCFARQDL